MIARVLEHYRKRNDALIEEKVELEYALQDCVDELSAWEDGRYEKSATLTKSRALLARLESERDQARAALAALKGEK